MVQFISEILSVSTLELGQDLAITQTMKGLCLAVDCVRLMTMIMQDPEGCSLVNLFLELKLPIVRSNRHVSVVPGNKEVIGVSPMMMIGL